MSPPAAGTPFSPGIWVYLCSRAGLTPQPVPIIYTFEIFIDTGWFSPSEKLKSLRVYVHAVPLPRQTCSLHKSQLIEQTDLLTNAQINYCCFTA